jgi:hypothetical protein
MKEALLKNQEAFQRQNLNTFEVLLIQRLASKRKIRQARLSYGARRASIILGLGRAHLPHCTRQRRVNVQWYAGARERESAAVDQRYG